MVRRSLLFAVLTLAPAFANAATYTVQTSQNSVSLSGSVIYQAEGDASLSTLGLNASTHFTASGGATLLPQGLGSLSTTLGGTLEATVGGGLVQFLGGNILGMNNGGWRPDAANNPFASAPANLGAVANPTIVVNANNGLVQFFVDFLSNFFEPTTYLAARDVEIAATGTTSLVGNTFTLGSISTTLTAGTVNTGVVSAVQFPGAAFGLAGIGGLLNLAQNGSVTSNGVVETITLPFDILVEDLVLNTPCNASGTTSFTQLDVQYSFSNCTASAEIDGHILGTIVAIRRLDGTDIPEPATLAIITASLSALALRRRRSRPIA
jgi:hypothetical protein